MYGLIWFLLNHILLLKIFFENRMNWTKILKSVLELRNILQSNSEFITHQTKDADLILTEIASISTDYESKSARNVPCLWPRNETDNNEAADRKQTFTRLYNWICTWRRATQQSTNNWDVLFTFLSESRSDIFCTRWFSSEGVWSPHHFWIINQIY